jgi:excisionase family DNA binding protein
MKKGVKCMSIYNTKEIAELLNINEETVRRWIRSGKLKAERSSKKQGNVVYEEDLFEFISDKPKYK